MALKPSVADLNVDTRSVLLGSVDVNLPLSNLKDLRKVAT